MCVKGSSFAYSCYPDTFQHNQHPLLTTSALPNWLPSHMYSQMLVHKHTVPIFSDFQDCICINKTVKLYFSYNHNTHKTKLLNYELQSINSKALSNET